MGSVLDVLRCLRELSEGGGQPLWMYLAEAHWVCESFSEGATGGGGGMPPVHQMYFTR